MPETKELTPCAGWTPDCQGKWDFDGPIIGISSRYHPRGGGFHVFNTNEPDKDFQSSADLHSEVKPSASSTIYLYHGEDEPYVLPEDINAPIPRVPYDWGRDTVLAEQEFEGETEVEVKAQVETWVQSQLNEIARILHDYYRVVSTNNTPRKRRKGTGEVQ